MDDIVDEISRLTQRAMGLAQRVNMDERLARFEIDSATVSNLHLFRPIVDSHIDRVIIKFYEYLHRFPETRRILEGKNIDHLREKQKRHWTRLLSGDFGHEYLNNTIMIGLVHFEARIPPHVYMASYNFFMNELLRIAGAAELGYGFQAIAISINKVIMLDMSIVLNTYFLGSLTAPSAPDKTVKI